MKKFKAFSLMEMMIVLMIVAVIATAGAPMINKKMSDKKEISQLSETVKTLEKNNARHEKLIEQLIKQNAELEKRLEFLEK